MVAVSAYELDLPMLDTSGLERSEALEAAALAGRRHWLARTPLGFSLTRYQDAVACLRDRRFHSALSLLPQMAGMEPGGYFDDRRRSILSMEGDEHTRLRRLVSPAFTPASADRLRPFMRAVINGLFDTVSAQGRCDLVADICEPYPIPIICELLGRPQGRLETLLGLGHRHLQALQPGSACGPADHRAGDERAGRLRQVLGRTTSYGPWRRPAQFSDRDRRIR